MLHKMNSIISGNDAAMMSRGGMFGFLFTSVLILLILCDSASAQSRVREEFTNVRVEMQVNKDRTVDITETITVKVLGQIIKRGLLRDIPVHYRNRLGSNVNLNLEVLSVTRDGNPEPYQQTYEGRYTRLRIGRASYFLSHGLYTYKIRYRVENALGIFDEFDEFYWNAHGDEWPFGARKIEAVVTLPQGANIQQYKVYTGARGRAEDNYRVMRQSGGVFAVETTRPFAPYEGLTIAVGWQKGVLDVPTFEENLAAWVKSNTPTFVILLAAFLQIGWLYRSWNRVGRDPVGGAIIPRFRAPKDVSPALASYVAGTGSFVTGQETTFMAALINLAIKRYVAIDNEDDMVVRRQKDPDLVEKGSLPVGEQALFTSLMETREKAVFKDFTYATMSTIMGAFTSAIHRETDQVYFRRNNAYLVPGFLLALAGLFGYIFTSILIAPPYQMPIFDILAAGLLSAVIVVIYSIWNMATKDKGLDWIAKALPPVFAVGVAFFVFSEHFTLVEFLTSPYFNPLAVLVLIAMVLALIIFSRIMKAPTKLGREIMDEVEGLKLFMTVTVAEQADVLPDKDMPDLTIQLYENLLPYAIALGVEKKWSKTFEEKLFSQLPEHKTYKPYWYHGQDFNPSRPTASFAAMTDTLGTDLSSAMTPPASSSSGSSGGGSSGGGGGGGGGGGW